MLSDVNKPSFIQNQMNCELYAAKAESYECLMKNLNDIFCIAHWIIQYDSVNINIYNIIISQNMNPIAT